MPIFGDTKIISLNQIISYYTKWIEKWYGYDFFISYRHAGAGAYADELHQALTTQDKPLRPFLDLEPDGFRVGGDLAAETVRAAGLASALVVLVEASLLDASSVYVPKEVELFATQNKLIVPVDLDGTLERLRTSPDQFASLPAHNRKMFAILLDRISMSDRTTTPSLELLKKLSGAIGSVNVARRRTRFYAALASLLALLTFLASLFWITARQQRLAAQKSARIERAQRCAAQSQLVAAQNPRLALLLAAESAQSTAGHEKEMQAETTAALSIASGLSSGYSWEVNHNLPDVSSGFDFDWDPASNTLLTSGMNGQLIEWRFTNGFPPSADTLLDLRLKRLEPLTFSAPGIPDLDIKHVHDNYLILERDTGRGRPDLLLSVRKRPDLPLRHLYSAESGSGAIFVNPSSGGRWIYIYKVSVPYGVLVDLANLEKPVSKRVASGASSFVGFSPSDHFLLTHSFASGTLQLTDVHSGVVDSLTGVGWAEMGRRHLHIWRRDSTFQRFAFSDQAWKKEETSWRVPYELGMSFTINEQETLVAFGRPEIPLLDYTQAKPEIRSLLPATQMRSFPSSLTFGGNDRWLLLSDAGIITLIDLEAAIAKDEIPPRYSIQTYDGGGGLSAFSRRTGSKRWLSVQSSSGGALLLDLLADKPLQAARHFPKIFNNATLVSPDGRWLFGRNSNSLGVWPLRHEDMLSLCKHLYPEGFTQEEWDTYFPNEPFRNTFRGVEELSFR